MFLRFVRRVGGILWGLYQTSLREAICRMDDKVSNFAERFALTVDKQRMVLIDDKKSALLRNTKVFLIERVLTSMSFNKDRFKKQMLNLWRPKVRVSIVKLKDGLFSCGFDNHRERAMIQKWGPWLYDEALVVLAEANELVHPVFISLSSQEF